MSHQIQRLFTPSIETSATKILRTHLRPGVLAVTADLRLYAGVLHAASSVRWRADWARTLGRAIEVCRLEATPIVIFDENLPGVQWSRAFDLINAVPSPRRILLASPRIDEELWRQVVLRRGYDIVVRSAASAEFERVLRFAWLSLGTPAT